MKTFNIKTAEGRLELYKDMLRFYKKGDFGTDVIPQNKACGFCFILWRFYNINIQYTMNDELPELYEMKPKILYSGASSFWFDYFDPQPRIKLLEKLIKKLEA